MLNQSDENAVPGQLFEIIRQANDHQISQIVSAVINRFAEIRPDEEVMFLTLPKNDIEECEQVIMGVLGILRSKNFLSNHADADT